MPSVPVLKSKKVVLAFVRMGYAQRKAKGDHVLLTKGSSTCCVPYNPKLPKGTLRRIAKQSGVGLETIIAKSK